MDTLFKLQPNNTDFSVGKKLFIKVLDKSIQVYKNYALNEVKPITSSFEKRLAVVELINNYGAMKSRIASTLGISRQSIDNWLDIYAKHGPQGLINCTKDSWKKNPKRFKGNKAKELQEDRFKAAEKIDLQQVAISFDAGAVLSKEVKTDLYTDTYNFEDNRYAGSMLIIGMIEKMYGFSAMACDLYGEKIGFLYLFAAMHILQIGSVEQLKVIKKKEFGRVIGRNKLPSLPNIWAEVHQAVSENKSNDLCKRTYDYQAVRGLVGLQELFLDGHFIPYYGKEKTHKGYFTQRDLMVKGQTQMFVHDSCGRVVYVETQEGKGDIVDTLKRTSQYISRLNNGQKPLIAIDREVWGVENFIHLSQERVVTWEKYCDQENLQQINIEEFIGELNKNGKTWQLYEDTKKYSDANKNKIQLRRIIIHNTKTNKRLCIVSTDKQEQKEVIAEVMLSRWGNNENSFKYMGRRTNMHYNPVIEIAESSKNQEIDNPQYKEVHKKLTTLKADLNKTERKLGKKPVTLNRDGGLRQNRSREELQNTSLNLKQQIQMITDQLSNIPKRIDVGQIDTEKFKVIDTEGINLWTICESMFWNSRKELYNRFLQFLPDKRDTLPVLESFIKAPGKIQSTATAIRVKLEVHDTPRYKSAQLQLMRYINTLNLRINGKLLQFDAMTS